MLPATPVPGELEPKTTCPPGGITACGTLGILKVPPELTPPTICFIAMKYPETSTEEHPLL